MTAGQVSPLLLSRPAPYPQKLLEPSNPTHRLPHLGNGLRHEAAPEVGGPLALRSSWLHVAAAACQSRQAGRMLAASQAAWRPQHLARLGSSSELGLDPYLSSSRAGSEQASISCLWMWSSKTLGTPGRPRRQSAGAHGPLRQQRWQLRRCCPPCCPAGAFLCALPGCW